MRYDHITLFDIFPASGQVICNCKMCDEEFTEELDEWQSEYCSACSDDMEAAINKGFADKSINEVNKLIDSRGGIVKIKENEDE